MPQPRDRLGRPVRDLRISVTDRCNFRCVYCMPKAVFGSQFRFLPKSELLSFEEIETVTRAFTELGVEKVRITGGEPLIRRHLETLIGRLAAIPGLSDIAMTTNGALLTPAKATALAEAGLKRITISLDALDDTIFQAMNDVGFPVSRVLDAINVAEQAGFSPIKINMVVKKGMNDDQILPMAAHFRGTPHIVRFIEYMDVGTANGWRMEEVVPAHAILEKISQKWPLRPLSPTRSGEVANRYAYADGGGEIGVIASVSQPFCDACSRARLSCDGHLYTCLFAAAGFDLRPLLRTPAPDRSLSQALSELWGNRQDRYSQQRSQSTPSLPKVEMFHIGG